MLYPPLHQGAARARRQPVRLANLGQWSAVYIPYSMVAFGAAHRRRQAEPFTCDACRQSVGMHVLICVCVCVCVCVWYYRFYQIFPVGPVWPHWCPRVGSLPIIENLRCRPGGHAYIAPIPLRYALRPEPGLLPKKHPGRGVLAPWLPPGQLHGNSSTSPSSPCRPTCCVCIGVFTAGGARGSEAASTAYSIWRSLQKRCP